VEPLQGAGPALTDLLGGRIDMMFAPGPVVQQFVASGQFKALGVTDTQRSKFYPDVPTVADAVPGYESVGWFGSSATAAGRWRRHPKPGADILRTRQRGEFCPWSR
jgi:tripartite-type tricarboxylate transporter receptor subunit TctC